MLSLALPVYSGFQSAPLLRTVCPFRYCHMLSENQQRSGVSLTLCSQAFSNKFLTVKIWSVVHFPVLNPAWYSPIIYLVYFLSLLLITVVNILYPLHSNDIPL